MNPPHTYYTPQCAEHEKTPTWMSFHVRRHSIAPTIPTENEMTPSLVFFSCSALFLCNTTHAEHEKTPTRMSFCVWHCSAIQHMPSTKDTLIGVVLCLASFICPRTCQRTHTGVLLFLASFLPPLTHAGHEKTPSLVCFRLQ